MNPQRRDLARRCLYGLLAALLLAPLFGALLSGTPFHRVLTRTVMICVFVALVLRRWQWDEVVQSARRLGLRGPHRGGRLLLGAGLALVLLSGLLFASWKMGGRVLAEGPHKYSLGYQLMKALVSALVVGVLEELFFRGYLLGVLGGIGSAAVYAVVHYFRPVGGSEPAGAYEPLLGFQRLPELFGSFQNTHNLTWGIGGLFLFGLALNTMRRRTGTLYLGIGVHAGLVFSLDVYRRILHDHAADPGQRWLYGGGRLYDGLLGWAMILYLLVLARWVALPHFLKPPEPEGEVTPEAAAGPSPPPPPTESGPSADAP